MIRGTDQAYLETLLLYYEEEIEGEAYFAELADAFQLPDQQEKLLLLAAVERFAAAAVTPLLARYGLNARAPDELVARGKAEARGTATDWTVLIAEMTKIYPRYLEAFRRLEAMAPARDRRRLALLSEHEVAAIEFLALETTYPERSADPLRNYLNIEPARWVAVDG